MAISKLIDSYAADAAADLSGSLNLLAKIDSNGNVALCGDGEAAVGPIIEAAAQGYSVTVQYLGIGKATAAETITPGAELASDAAGKLVAAAAADHIVGIAVSGGDADELVSFIITHGREHA